MDEIFSSGFNPNKDILEVPQQEGEAEEDHYFGDIGASTSRHVSSLSFGERQLWEGLIVTKNGLIFRTEPSPNQHDPDPFNLKGKDMERYFEKIRRDNKGKFIPHDTFDHLKEAMEEESARAVKSEDAYSRSELLSYDQLEKFPGMMKYIDIPQTPRDLFVYMGNTNQMFYDEFPEGCQDSKVINTVLSILNKKEEKLTPDYLEWFRDTFLPSQVMRPYTLKYLTRLTNDLLLGEEPEEAAQKALSSIEANYKVEYLNKAAHLARQDKIYMLLYTKEKEWTKQFKSGKNVYPSIKMFGKALFDISKEEGMPRAKAHHWDRYRRIKTKLAPRVYICGIDVNRADMYRLKKLFKKQSEDIWFKRPFESTIDLVNKGYVTRSTFAESNSEEEQLLEGLDLAILKAKQENNLSSVNKYREQLIMLQKTKYTNVDWSNIWTYYNLVKGDILEREK